MEDSETIRRIEASPAERLNRWSRVFNPVVVIAAILPLAAVVADDDPTTGPGALLSLGCWLVFAVDFAVRIWLSEGFLRTWKGKTYLFIVVVTFPLFLLVPGLEETDLLAVARLGWLAVLAVAGAESAHEARVLVNRIGAAGLYAATAVLVAAIVVNRVEDAEDGFASFGDSLWWALSTITTVGYGDRVPVTNPGRFIAALLMLSGLAFLGVIAASLAAFFGIGDRGTDEESGEPTYADLVAEVRSLRAAVERLAPDAESDGDSTPQE